MAYFMSRSYLCSPCFHMCASVGGYAAETHQKEASTAAGLPALMAHLQALPWASKVEQSLLPLMRSYQGRAQGCLVTAASRAPCRAPLAVTL
eukprot:1150752-Pelagomonas_calceolata.AAC.5